MLKKAVFLHSVFNQMTFLSKRIPLSYLLITVILFTGVLFYISLHPVKVIEKIESKNNCDIQLLRDKSYKYIAPLLMIETAEEDPMFTDLKSTINNYFSQEKSSGSLTSASVYVRDFEKGKWFAINPDEKYSPGSVMKIMTLITFLKESERDPSLLNKEIKFSKHISELPTQSIVVEELQEGKYYSVKELLTRMITDSNNDATALLNSMMDFSTYFTILKGINLDLPSIYQADYPLTAVQTSRLLRLIYNSGVLSTDNSEYAMTLLSKSKFHDGIENSLPKGVDIAHKFGEKFTPSEQQLHETAIIYCNNKPYLLTVMTKGTKQDELKHVLSKVSSQVWDFMASR